MESLSLAQLGSEDGHRAGFVSIVGKPNAGKSTLLNALLGQKLAIVTNKPQTTRHRIMGVLSGQGYQIVFVDTPGVIEPRYKLQQRMMGYVSTALRDADLILWVAAFDEKYDESDVIKVLGETKAPVLLCLNKADIATAEQVAERVHALAALHPIKEAVSISALYGANLSKLVERIVAHLPESPAFYDPDTLTDRPEKFFVAEMVREKIFEAYEQEIPYATEVSILQFLERENGTVYIEAEIHVERQSQKAILIGREGLKIKEVGVAARQDIEKFLDKPVYLKLYVRVAENWKENERMLRSFGYTDQ